MLRMIQDETYYKSITIIEKKKSSVRCNTFNPFGYQIHDDRHDFITTIIISWIIPQIHDERFKCMYVIMTNFMIRIMNLMLTVVFANIALFFFFASSCNHQ